MDEVTKYILQELKEIKAQQNQMYQMISDLIRIVGNTNAMLEETRSDVATLKADVAEIKEWQYKTDERLERLENKFDRFERDQNENSFVLRDITYRVAKHETDIADLRRA